MSPAPLPDLRVESRSNIFVMATMYAGAGSTPVRVRNMSRTGALVEAAILPPVGTTVRLSRGSLNALGDVMWASAGRAGLRFASPVAILDWLPQGKRGSGQQLIDEIVHRARVSGTQPAHPPRRAQATVEIADEIVQLRQMLERVSEELSADPAVSSGEALQILDAVGEGLGKLVLRAMTSLPPSVKTAG